MLNMTNTELYALSTTEIDAQIATLARIASDAEQEHTYTGCPWAFTAWQDATLEVMRLEELKAERAKLAA